MLLDYYNEAPESVRKFALAFMEATGTGARGLLELTPEVLLIFSAGTRVSATDLIAAIRWLSEWHAARVNPDSSDIDQVMASHTAKKLAAHAEALEALCFWVDTPQERAPASAPTVRGELTP